MARLWTLIFRLEVLFGFTVMSFLFSSETIRLSGPNTLPLIGISLLALSIQKTNLLLSGSPYWFPQEHLMLQLAEW